MMGAIQPSFQVSERTVNMKGMRVGGMKPRFVAFQRGFGIAPPSIGVNLAAGLHALLQKVANRDGIGSLGQRQAKASGLFHFLSMLVGVGDDFDGPENQRAMDCLGHAATPFSSDRAADNDFVGFHATGQARSRVAHPAPTQPVQNEPCCLVSASQLTLELLGTHSGGEGCNQVGRPKPVLDGKMAAMKKRSRRDRRLMSALLTFMRVPTQDPPTAGTVALRTAKSFRPTALRKILPAVRVTRKLLPEFTQAFRECRSWHLQYLRKPSTCIKWIIIMHEV
jgi:hypothetical protein